jgi:hypothetical protein
VGGSVVASIEWLKLGGGSIVSVLWKEERRVQEKPHETRHGPLTRTSAQRTGPALLEEKNNKKTEKKKTEQKSRRKHLHRRPPPSLRR